MDDITRDGGAEETRGSGGAETSVGERASEVSRPAASFAYVWTKDFTIRRRPAWN